MSSPCTPSSASEYAAFLRTAGFKTWEIGGVHWFEYNGFLRPATLPHCTPQISRDLAKQALKEAGSHFARWDSDFGSETASPWWYVVRSGPYEMAQVSGNTRSKIRRGAKRLTARKATVDEIEAQGMDVCRAAVGRYGESHFLPTPEAFAGKIQAAREHPESFEFFGAFADDTLVAFSENQIQGSAVFWESIWYDPDALRNYSSYLLTHEMLEHYLNERGMEYASDGSRSLYHDTNVQAFFVDKFGFERRYTRMHIVYSSLLGPAVGALYPLRSLVDGLAEKTSLDAVKRVQGLLVQEGIARECKRA